jgi:hypothetical protein
MRYRKIYSICVWGAVGIVVSYLLFFFINAYITRSRLNTIDGKSNFDITSILDISKDRITAESETYNKEEFVEYDCRIDSIYSITIVKVGEVANTKLENILSFSNKRFPVRDGWFVYNVTTAHPMATMFLTNYWFYYNVFLLPMKEKVNKVNIYVQGEIFEKEMINNSTLSYSVKDTSVQFSFNDINKADMYLSQFGTRKPPLSNMFFSMDKDNNLYIGCVSTDKGCPKTLREIIDLELPMKSSHKVKSNFMYN